MGHSSLTFWLQKRLCFFGNNNGSRLVDRSKLINVWIVQLIMYTEYLADSSTKVISLAFFSPEISSEYKDMKKVYLKVSLLLYI